MANSLLVNTVSNEDLTLDYMVLKNTFDTVSNHHIDKCPWSEDYPYQPAVSFKIVHSADYIALYYHVQEDFVKAQAIRANENVWEDSCVEFFFSLDNKQTYYNFEFNVLGTGLIGYGPGVKTERNRLSATQIDSVDTLTQLVKRNGKKVWEIFLVIPKDLFPAVDFESNTFHGNFYKCGDALPQAHFITWSTIDYPKPNFHLPQFFGELKFQ